MLCQNSYIYDYKPCNFHDSVKFLVVNSLGSDFLKPKSSQIHTLVWILQEYCSLISKYFIRNDYLSFSFFWYLRLLFWIRSQSGVACKIIDHKKHAVLFSSRPEFRVYFCAYLVFHFGNSVEKKSKLGKGHGKDRKRYRGRIGYMSGCL